jgi:hypothetical protein
LVNRSLKIIAHGMVLVPALAFALATGGCGSSSPAASANGSCTISTTVSAAGMTATKKGCEELSNVSTAQAQAFMQQCMTTSGQADAGFSQQITYAAGACSHDGAVGGCRVTQAGGTLTIWFYTGGQTAAQVQQQCAATNGTFVSP